MSGSDRYLSMSLDDIIKLKKQQKPSSRKANNIIRGQQRNGAGFGRSGQRRFLQHRGNFRGQQRQQPQQQRPRRGFRGNKQRGLQRWDSRQSVSSLQRGSIRAWSSHSSLTSPQASQAHGRKGFTTGQAAAARGGAKSRVLRGVSNRTQQQGATTRGPQRLNATQLARNRVRLAAQILMQRKQQLHNLQERGGIQRGENTIRRHGRGFLRGRVMPGRRGARGKLLNKLAVVNTVHQKMARAGRNRQSNEGEMLRVSINNERALNPPALTDLDELPTMLVINESEIQSYPEPVFRVPRQRRRRPPVFIQEDADTVLTAPPRSGRRLTLHERFSQC